MALLYTRVPGARTYINIIHMCDYKYTLSIGLSLMVLFVRLLVKTTLLNQLKLGGLSALFLMLAL